MTDGNATMGALLPHLALPVIQDQILTRHRHGSWRTLTSKVIAANSPEQREFAYDADRFPVPRSKLTGGKKYVSAGTAPTEH